MTGKPGDHLRVFVGCIIVEDDVDGFLRRHGFFDGVEEADEFLMAMALHAPADHLALQHVESCKEGSGPCRL